MHFLHLTQSTLDDADSSIFTTIVTITYDDDDDDDDDDFCRTESNMKLLRRTGGSTVGSGLG